MKRASQDLGSREISRVPETTVGVQPVADESSRARLGRDDHCPGTLPEAGMKESSVMERSIRWLTHAALSLLGLNGIACAHDREVIYPNGNDGLATVRTDRGLRVRAP